MADVTQVALPKRSFDVWHDRAVFHFLTHADDRERYIENLRFALRPDGDLIVATFALPDGPLRCSGLDVERYDVEKLQTTFGAEFELIESFRDEHTTPFGTIQNFVYGHFKFRPRS